MKRFITLFLLGLLGLSTNPANAMVSTEHVEYKAYSKLRHSILEASQKTGTKTNTLIGLIGIESTMGLHTANRTSSARGVAQHTSRQWRADLQKHHKQLGLSANASVHNPRASILVTAAALADNRAYLESHTGLKVTDGDLYASWLVGLDGAARILKGKPNAPISRYVKLSRGNGKMFYRHGRVMTVKEFRAAMQNRMQSEAMKYVTAYEGVHTTNRS